MGLTVEDLRKRLTPRYPAGNWIPRRPTPKQVLFLLLPYKEVLFGGGGGSGKSDASLQAALQYVDVPGYAATIFRSTYTSLTLPDGLIPRSHAWLGKTKAYWQGDTHSWTFPSGAVLRFGYLEHQRHLHRYQGSANQYLGWEELTEWPKPDYYEFMFGWLRRPSHGPLSKVPLRVRSTTNPVGPGYQWVKDRFIRAAHPDRWYVHATYRDNPYLDPVAYRASLSHLPPVLRKKIEDGDWSEMATGEFFPRSKFRVIGPDAVPKLVKVVRLWDLAATEPSPTNDDPDWTAGVKQGWDEANRPYILHTKRLRAGPDGVEAAVKQTAIEDGRYCYVRMHKDPGQAGVSQIAYYSRVLAGFDFDGVSESGDIQLRAAPFSSQVRAGNVSIVDDGGNWLSPFLDEHDNFPYAPKDDQVAASSSGFNFLVTAKPMVRFEAAYGPRIQ